MDRFRNAGVDPMRQRGGPRWNSGIGEAMAIRWGRLQPAIWATVILLVSITAADAEGDKASKPSEFILLAQIALRAQNHATGVSFYGTSITWRP